MTIKKGYLLDDNNERVTREFKFETVQFIKEKVFINKFFLFDLSINGILELFEYPDLLKIFLSFSIFRKNEIRANIIIPMFRYSKIQ